MCGSDGSTYSSKCHLLGQNCRRLQQLQDDEQQQQPVTIASDGECPTLPIYSESEDGQGGLTARYECKNYEWQCESDGSCIPLTGQCDDIADCPNGEDEKFCQEVEKNETAGAAPPAQFDSKMTKSYFAI